MQGREPLDPARITAAVGRDRSRAPFLGGGPLDHVEAVGAVIAVGLELTVGIASAADIDPDRDVAGPRERVGACARAFISTAVWRAHHDRGRRTVGGQHEIRRERDPIAHRDPDVEATRQSFADGWGHQLAILADGPPASVARRPRRSAPFRRLQGRRSESAAHRARAAARSQSPADDPLRMQTNQWRRQRDRLRASADLDTARPPGVGLRSSITIAARPE